MLTSLLKNDFPEYQDVVDEVTKAIACENLREITKVPKSWEEKKWAPKAIPKDGQVVMPEGMDKDRFASVLVEEVCHVCLAPGAKEEEILEAIKTALECGEEKARTIRCYAADLICEFEIKKRTSLVGLRLPKIRRFLSDSYTSPTLREFQATFAQLYGQSYHRSSSIFEKANSVMETVQDRVDQFLEISQLIHPIIDRELGSSTTSKEGP